MRIQCPECDHDFVVTVTSASPASSDPASPLTARTLRAVHDFMKTLEPGRHTAAGLYVAFQAWPDNPTSKALTPNAFGRALKRNGAKPYRTSSERGYDIPDVAEDAQPAKPAAWVEKQQFAANPTNGIRGNGERRALSPSGKLYTISIFDAENIEHPVEKPQWVIDEEEAAVKPEFVDDYPVPSFVGPL